MIDPKILLIPLTLMLLIIVVQLFYMRHQYNEMKRKKVDVYTQLDHMESFSRYCLSSIFISTLINLLAYFMV